MSDLMDMIEIIGHRGETLESFATDYFGKDWKSAVGYRLSRGFFEDWVTSGKTMEQYKKATQSNSM